MASFERYISISAVLQDKICVSLELLTRIESVTSLVAIAAIVNFELWHGHFDLVLTTFLFMELQNPNPPF